ncbi:hypothetical protein H2199_004827 [Coniosporium tulheliwenetii]|uniref:Uncharacterized protein n=1 Tax=Coniosporium tulheliwenetii TaxID=3383036 RepID=A0ACC2Z455_9PEZI|nr:hypothetical protein H2199_004827 [Cladosporium sp. JES 115]
MASSSASKKHEWLVILPDKEGALEKRMKVRPEHLEKVRPLADAGLVPFGGAFLSELPKEGEQPKLAGSAMIAVGESREEVVEMLKKDVYTREGVWDWDKVQMWPFKTAIRKAL